MPSLVYTANRPAPRAGEQSDRLPARCAALRIRPFPGCAGAATILGRYAPAIYSGGYPCRLHVCSPTGEELEERIVESPEVIAPVGGVGKSWLEQVGKLAGGFVRAPHACYYLVDLFAPGDRPTVIEPAELAPDTVVRQVVFGDPLTWTVLDPADGPYYRRNLTIINESDSALAVAVGRNAQVPRFPGDHPSAGPYAPNWFRVQPGADRSIACAFGTQVECRPEAAQDGADVAGGGHGWTTILED